MKEILILQNAVAKNLLKKTYNSIVKTITQDTVVGFKVSPIDFVSELSTYIYTRVCNAYCFSSIRGCFVLNSQNRIDIQAVVSEILEDFPSTIDILSKKHNWYILYLNGYPSLVYKISARKRSCVYSFFIPGTADRPLAEKNSINYLLTMSYPKFEKSFYFNADYVLTFIVDKLHRLYSGDIRYINNIEYTLYKNSFLHRNLNRAIQYLNENSIPFNNTIIDIFSKRKYLLNIDHTKDLQLRFTKRKRPSFLVYPINEGDLIRVIYNINARCINNIQACHNLARRLSMLLRGNFKISSYYQKGFDIIDKNFDKYNTLAYGHNTLLEKVIVAKSSIHIYYQDVMYNIQIYDKGMFMIIGPTINDVIYNNIRCSGLDIINKITDILCEDL